MVISSWVEEFIFFCPLVFCRKVIEMLATQEQIKNQLIPRLLQKIEESGGNIIIDSDTAIVKLAIGNTAPTENNVLWFDTSDYESGD